MERKQELFSKEQGKLSFELFLKINGKRYENIESSTSYLFFLVDQNNLDALKLEAQHLNFESLNNQVDAFGRPLLELATIKNHQAILDYFYRQFKPPFNAQDEHFCWEAICNLSEPSSEGKFDVAAFAACWGYNSVLQAILEESEEDAEELVLEVFELAAYHHRIDIVASLIRNFSNLLDYEVALAEAISGTAIKTGRELKTVEFLIDNGAQLNEPVSNRTPLEMALSVASFDIFKLLIERGADINRCNEQFSLISALVCRKNVNDETRLKMLELLLNHIHLKPKDRAEAFQSLIVFQLQGGADEDFIYPAIQLFCLSNQSLLFQPLKLALNDNTPLHEAARKVNYDLAEILLEFSANVDKVNKVNNRPLHILLESVFGADYSLKKTGYDTDVVLKFVSLLLDKGANFKEPGANNKSPIEAVQYNKTALQKKLFNLFLCEDQIRALLITLEDGLKETYGGFLSFWQPRYPNLKSLCDYVNGALNEVKASFPECFEGRILGILNNRSRLNNETYERFKQLDVVAAIDPENESSMEFDEIKWAV